MLEKIDDNLKDLSLAFYNEVLLQKVLDSTNILGCIIYGSSTTGNFQNSSDIDMLLLVNKADFVTRGVKVFRGQKFEYFIKPIEEVLSETIKYTNSNTPSQVALYQNGFILVDNYGLVNNFLKTAKDYYVKNHKQQNQNLKLELAQISNRISSLKNIFDKNDVEFDYVYYNVLEMIRSFYSKFNGEAQVGFAKAYKVYNNPDYYDKYIGKDAGNTKPNDTFIELFNKCVKPSDNLTEKLNSLIDLYNFVKTSAKEFDEEYEVELP